MNPPMVENILAQPAALRAVMNYQYGEGRDSLLAAADLLRSSKRIVLSGMGASLYACIPLSNFLASRGVAVSVVETSELLYFQTNILNSDTALVLVSRSGESVEATKLLPAAREHGCKIVGVVNVPGSSLAKQSTQRILLNCPPDQLVAIQTYTASLIVLELLGSAVAGALDGGVQTQLAKTIDVLSECVPEWFRFSGSWPGFFAHGVPLYLLGRGPSLASAQAGALLLHEVAKMPAIALSLPQFRHGPVEVVNDRFRAIIFGSQRATASLDGTLAERIVQMGGNVRWIGPASQHPAVVPLCPWPEGVPDRFTPVVEIIPMQMAAFHTAEWQGFTAGEFKYATPVTLSEQDFAPLLASLSTSVGTA